MNCNVEIRKAERQDVPLLLEFIRGIAGRARQRLWKSIAATSGQDSKGALLWTYGVVMPELEPAKNRLLPLTRSRAYEGMDGVSAGF